MMTLGIEQAASRNLIGTYFRLGAATPGARLWHEDGFRICTGAFEHPICNFAADLSLSRQSALRLLEIAVARPSFNVYVLPGDEPSNASRILESVGFRQGHALALMAAKPIWKPTCVELLGAQTRDERARVARFMMEQFFGRQSHSFRKRVSETTCAAIELPLYTVEDKGNIVGAVMLSDEGSATGVYNLCVSYPFRSRGWGAEIVQAVLNLAAEHNRPVVLQCEESLQGWYQGRTFTRVGMVGIHNLPKSQSLAIMEQS